MKLKDITTFLLAATGLTHAANFRGAVTATRKVSTDEDTACIANAAEGYSYKFVSQHGNCVDTSGDVATCEPRLDYGDEQCFTNTDSDTASLWYNSEDTTRGSYYDTFEVLFDTNYGNITAIGEEEIHMNCVEPNNCEVASPANAYILPTNPPTGSPTGASRPDSSDKSSNDAALYGGFAGGVVAVGLIGLGVWAKTSGWLGEKTNSYEASNSVNVQQLVDDMLPGLFN